MQPMVISEAWTASSAQLSAEDFFAYLGDTPFALLHGGGRWIIHGEDPLLVLEEPELRGFAFERSGALPPILPDFIGFVGYEFGRILEPLFPAAAAPEFPFPEFHFALYRRLRIFDRETGTLYVALREGPRTEPQCRNLLKIGSFAAKKHGDSDTPEQYCAKIARIREEIAAGNVYQVNLTRQEQWRFSGDLTEFAQRLSLADPAPHSAFITGRDFGVVSASPESFLRMDQGHIFTRPIKGTAPRSLDPNEDEALAQALLASTKNRAELAMIADLLRNDLTRVCRVPSVRVEHFPLLESYARVHHLVATIHGELRPGLTLKELLRATFPGGSITGCPKLSAATLIRELEAHPRCVYTGALGWFSHDLSQLHLSIAIRTAWTSKDELRFGVGGGIVWDSEPQDEYLETVHKGASLVRCLN
jgi:para-aminobenzoate synthetase component 1